ncbi:MAG TPA: CAP domain-containing protein [Candidatus Saccharimonadales bacterium]|nr:CAP domain-containing protein [Candidatus Saccharimonadales bacterium]
MSAKHRSKSDMHTWKGLIYKIIRSKLNMVLSFMTLAFIAATFMVAWIPHRASLRNVQSSSATKSSVQNKGTSPVQTTPLTTANIVSLLNQQRTGKGLSAFKWITQLNNAATARANYMVTNNITSATAGDAGADITNANYNDSSWQMDVTWGDSTPQQVVANLTTGNAVSFGDSTKFSDIGVGIVPDTISGKATQLIVIYIANQATQQNTAQQNNYISPLESELNAEEQQAQARAAACPSLQSTEESVYRGDVSTAQQEQTNYENTLPNFLMYPSSKTEIDNYTIQLNDQLESEYNQISATLSAQGCTNLIYEQLLFEP